MKLANIINESSASTIVYKGDSDNQTNKIPGFCTTKLVVALSYGAVCKTFIADNLQLVDHKRLGEYIMLMSGKDIPIGTKILNVETGECVYTEPVQMSIMSPAMILKSLQTGEHELSPETPAGRVDWYSILEYGEERFGDLYPQFIEFAADHDLIDPDDFVDE